MEMKHIIYTNDASDEYIEECRQTVAENLEKPVEEVTDSELWDEVAFAQDLWYEDERGYLDIPLAGRVLMVADLGLWHGRRSGYKILDANLNAVLSGAVGDYFTVGSDGHNIVAKDVHHDGTNYYTYREIREDRNIDILLDKLYNGTATRADINRYTRSLAGKVAEVYGWRGARRKEERKAA